MPVLERKPSVVAERGEVLSLRIPRSLRLRFQDAAVADYQALTPNADQLIDDVSGNRAETETERGETS